MTEDRHDCDEHVLCGDEWKVEANAVIRDVHDHVHSICIADGPPITDQQIFLNLTTKEMVHYCVELSPQGFRIVGNSHNQNSISSEEFYETPYALLDKLSPLYRKAFGDSLVLQLQNLHHSQTNSSGAPQEDV